MRVPIYASRPVELHAARFGGERINDSIVKPEGNSNAYLIEMFEGDILVNIGMGFEAPVYRKSFDGFSAAPLKYVITTQGHVGHVGGAHDFREHNPGLQYIAQAGNTEHQTYDASLQTLHASRSGFACVDKFAEVFS